MSVRFRSVPEPRPPEVIYRKRGPAASLSVSFSLVDLQKPVGGAGVCALSLLGRVQADSGLAAGYAQVYLAELSACEVSAGHEGIRDLLWLTREQLREAISRGEITDGFTLSALALLEN